MRVRRTFQPRKVQVVRFEGKGLEENRLTQVAVFFFVYVLLVLAGMFLVSLEGLYDLETNFTAALTCISNVGPGLGHVGPVENFAGYGPFCQGGAEPFDAGRQAGAVPPFWCSSSPRVRKG